MVQYMTENFFGITEQFIRFKHRIDILKPQDDVDIILIHNDDDEVDSIMKYIEGENDFPHPYQIFDLDLNPEDNRITDWRKVSDLNGRVKVLYINADSIDDKKLYKTLGFFRRIFYTKTKKDAEKIKGFFDILQNDSEKTRSTYILEVPDIKERIGDIPLIVFDTLNNGSKKRVVQVPKITSHAMLQLMQISWRNTTELKSFLLYLRSQGHSEVDEITEDMCKTCDIITKPFETPQSLKKVLPYHTEKDKFEESYWRRLLFYTKGKVTEAARISGFQRQNVYLQLNKFNIKPSDYRK